MTTVTTQGQADILYCKKQHTVRHKLISNITQMERCIIRMIFSRSGKGKDNITQDINVAQNQHNNFGLHVFLEIHLSRAQLDLFLFNF